MSDPMVYILHVNYNNWQDLGECLESQLNFSYTNFKILIADNGSSDGSEEKLKQWAAKHDISLEIMDRERFQNKSISALAKMTLVRIGYNSGFAIANNVLLNKITEDKQACGWMLNPDMIPEPDCLEKLVKFAQGKQKTVFGTLTKSLAKPARILYIGGFSYNKWTGTISFIRSMSQLKQLDAISGGSLFARTEDFEKVGLLTEQYFIYWEDAEWCKRAMDMNYKFDVCSDAVCYDKISTTMGKGYKAEYFYTLNGLKFFSKYYPAYLPFILASSFLRITKRFILFKFNNLKAVINGTADFFKQKKYEPRHIHKN